MTSPIAIDTAPHITVQRMPYRYASRPITMPPKEVPNQASELASEGADRPPPSSAAIGFRATAVIQSAPNDVAISATETVATIHEDRVSRLWIDKIVSRRVEVASRA